MKKISGTDEDVLIWKPSLLLFWANLCGAGCMAEVARAQLE